MDRPPVPDLPLPLAPPCLRFLAGVGDAAGFWLVAWAESKARLPAEWSRLLQHSATCNVA